MGVKAKPRAGAALGVTTAGLSSSLREELSSLLLQTYELWDPGWVNFNWRAYTYDHVQRVRGLALTLAAREGADPAVVELAALLHDITKPYDGDYVTDGNGKRAVDGNGYWHNETRPPGRSNAVTELYDRLGLAGTPHNESGAVIAGELLRARGIDEGVVVAVCCTIADHLRPSPDVPTESRCLYDADTIDANIGLPAFVRNIYIHLHYRDVRKRSDEPPTDEMLRESPLDYLGPYVGERLPAWSLGKRNDFVPRLLCGASVEIADERLRRLDAVWTQLRAELGRYDEMAKRGCLGVVLYFMGRREEPSVDALVAELRDVWARDADPTPEALALIRDLDREVRGVT